MSDGEVTVNVKAGTADFERALNSAKKEAERFDKEATEAAAAALKLSKSATEAAKSAAKLKTEAAGSAKGTAALKKNAAEAAKSAAALKKQTAEAARAAKQLQKDAKNSATSTAALKLEAAAAAKRIEALRTASAEAAREVRVLRKAAQDSAKGTAALKKEMGEAARKANALKIGARGASKEAKVLSRRGATAADGVKKMRRATERANPKLSRFQRLLKNSSDAASLITGPLGGVASRINTLGRITSVTAAVMLGMAVAVGAVTVGLSKAIAEAEKFQRSGLRTEAVLRATGHAAGFTAGEIREMSEEIARTTLASTSGVEAAAAKLLTFRSIQTDVFSRALSLSQDLAELGFGSVESGALQLGKALEDPLTGLTALSRIGVTFSAAQKEQIKQFVKMNELAKAQGVILDVLSSQVGGTGVAAAQGLTGAYDTLGQEVSEFQQNIGNAGGIQFMTGVTNDLTVAVRALNAALFTTPADKIQELLAARARAARFADIPILSGAVDARIAGITREILALQNKRVEEQKAASAAKESAEIARVAAIKEAEAAKLLEKQAAERERLTKLRQKATSTIQGEIAVLRALTQAQTDANATSQELAEIKQRITTLTRLGLDASSKEGAAISALIAERMRLTSALAQERAEREQAAATASRLQAIETEITAVGMLTDAIGGSTAEVREARIAAKAYRIEQEMIASALMSQGDLTAKQTDAIRRQAQALAENSVRLEDMQTAQTNMLAAEQEANARRAQFQETLASSLTSVITGAESAEDALKNMVLQLSQAIIQAQILNAIQGQSGTGGGIIGAISGAFSSATAPAASADTVAATKLHRGGIGGRSGQTVNTPVSNFIAAPRFHNGLKPDEFPAILQRGEEVVPKDQVGRGGASARPIVFNVSTPDADSFRKSQRQISRKLRQTTAAT